MKNRKLTLEELSPYLPYGLQCMTKDKSGQIWVLCCENIKHAMQWWKPLLLPLSEFNNSAADNEIFEIGQLYSSVELNEISEFPYWQIKILLKHHFDVFGLIEDGLAINKLTVNAL